VPMNFLRKSYDSETSHGVRQSRALADQQLRSTPIRRVGMHGFPYELSLRSVPT